MAGSKLFLEVKGLEEEQRLGRARHVRSLLLCFAGWLHLPALAGVSEPDSRRVGSVPVSLGSVCWYGKEARRVPPKKVEPPALSVAFRTRAQLLLAGPKVLMVCSSVVGASAMAGDGKPWPDGR